MTSEYWANVRVYDGLWAGVGNRRETREACKAATALSPVLPAFRIHVRLKPEGAPKRYASEANRRAWERRPGFCVGYVAMGGDPRRVEEYATGPLFS